MPLVYSINKNYLKEILNNKIKNKFHEENGFYDINDATYLDTLLKYLNLYTNSIKNCTHYKINDNKNILEYYFSYDKPNVYTSNIEWHNFKIHQCDNQKLTWFQFFKDKKLLFITSFPETAKKQISSGNIFKMFGVKKQNINIDFVKAPVSFCYNTPDKNMIESFEKLKNDVADKNFDIAIIGCGGYSMIIGDYIFKKMNKTSIVTGGTIQLFFGIKRW